MPVNKVSMSRLWCLFSRRHLESRIQPKIATIAVHITMTALQNTIRLNTHYLEELDRRSAPSLASMQKLVRLNRFNIGYVNTSPIRYGFWVATHAIRYNLNLSLINMLKLVRAEFIFGGIFGSFKATFFSKSEFNFASMRRMGFD